jgi:hypothetical protein
MTLLNVDPLKNHSTGLLHSVFFTFCIPVDLSRLEVFRHAFSELSSESRTQNLISRDLLRNEVDGFVFGGKLRVCVSFGAAAELDRRQQLTAIVVAIVDRFPVPADCASLVGILETWTRDPDMGRYRVYSLMTSLARCRGFASSRVFLWNDPVVCI